MGQVDFTAINRAALADLPAVLRHWMHDGQLIGEEFTAKNPTRTDRRPGSFRINCRTGLWADFATNDRGGDPVSLIAYLDGCGQVEAARRLTSETLRLPRSGAM